MHEGFTTESAVLRSYCSMCTAYFYAHAYICTHCVLLPLYFFLVVCVVLFLIVGSLHYSSTTILRSGYVYKKVFVIMCVPLPLNGNRQTTLPVYCTS